MLVAVQKCAGPEVWIDVAQAVKEYVRPLVFIHLAHVLHNLVVNMMQELITVGSIEKAVRNFVRKTLLLLKQVLQVRRIFIAKRLPVEVIAELLKYVERQHVNVL